MKGPERGETMVARVGVWLVWEGQEERGLGLRTVILCAESDLPCGVGLGRARR